MGDNLIQQDIGTHENKPDFMGCDVCQWNITGTPISWDVIYVNGISQEP